MYDFDGYGLSFSKGLTSFANELKMWSRRKFGNLSRHIGMIQKEMKELSLQTKSNEVIQKYRLLGKNLDCLLLLDEYLWRQRSWAQWLHVEDMNIKFFHRKTSQLWDRR